MDSGTISEVHTDAKKGATWNRTLYLMFILNRYHNTIKYVLVFPFFLGGFHSVLCVCFQFQSLIKALFTVETGGGEVKNPCELFHLHRLNYKNNVES